MEIKFHHIPFIKTMNKEKENYLEDEKEKEKDKQSSNENKNIDPTFKISPIVLLITKEKLISSSFSSLSFLFFFITSKAF